MKYKDMKQAVNLLANEWNLGKKESGASGNICAWIYLMNILEETEQFVYYRENGKLLGFAGYSNVNSKKNKYRKKYYNYIKKCLYKSKKIKDVNALYQYEEDYDYVPNNMKNYFDGEVTILILDNKCRGKGIGRSLLQQLFDLAKQDGMKNLQILTDEACSYGIYEKLGCKRIYETIITNREYGKICNRTTEKAFIYEKTL